MIFEAKIISVEIKQVDGINQIILTAEAEYGHNVQALLYNPAGDFSVPLPDDFVSILKIPGSGAYIAIGNLNNIQNVNEGEKKIYSRNSNGVTKASIYLKNDKTIVLNEGTDFAVRYNELKTQLDQLKTDFNNFVSVKFNAHKHTGVQAGAGTSGTSDITGSPTTADFTQCKVSKIKLPSVSEDAT